MWLIKCPGCGLTGVPKDFDESCAGECWCPQCGEAFMFEPDDEDDDDADE